MPLKRFLNQLKETLKINEAMDLWPEMAAFKESALSPRFGSLPQIS
jgi:hypothetical protein